jgi:hypothetical protein
VRKFAILLLVFGGSAITPAPAAAQAGAANPDITVTGDNRIVCRRLTRTATRMGTGRICRSQRQWAQDSGSQAAATNNPNATVDGAADTLVVNTEKVSTNCVGGMPGNSGGAGPY